MALRRPGVRCGAAGERSALDLGHHLFGEVLLLLLDPLAHLEALELDDPGAGLGEQAGK